MVIWSLYETLVVVGLWSLLWFVLGWLACLYYL
jgi:hypothetical protein